MFKQASLLLQKHKELRYLVSGATSEAIEFGSFLLLIKLTNLLYISNSISFVLGIASGFAFHKLWSFAGVHYLGTRKQTLYYAMIAGVNFIAANVLVGLQVHYFHIIPAIAKLISIVVIAGWSYLLFNKIIFMKRAAPTDSSESK